jgi:hypothetical protein
MKIIRFEDSLYASNIDFFKTIVYKLTNVMPQDYLNSIKKIMKSKKNKSKDAEKTVNMNSLTKKLPPLI